MLPALVIMIFIAEFLKSESFTLTGQYSGERTWFLTQ